MKYLCVDWATGAWTPLMIVYSKTKCYHSLRVWFIPTNNCDPGQISMRIISFSERRTFAKPADRWLLRASWWIDLCSTKYLLLQASMKIINTGLFVRGVRRGQAMGAQASALHFDEDKAESTCSKVGERGCDRLRPFVFRMGVCVPALCAVVAGVRLDFLKFNLKIDITRMFIWLASLIPPGTFLSFHNP